MPFSVELSQLSFSGQVNGYDDVYYFDENPNLIMPISMDKRSVHIWAGLSARGLIGPFVLSGSVTGASYKALLQDQVLPIINTWPGHCL
jgi:hypothetical protein